MSNVSYRENHVAAVATGESSRSRVFGSRARLAQLYQSKGCEAGRLHPRCFAIPLGDCSNDLCDSSKVAMAKVSVGLLMKGGG